MVQYLSALLMYAGITSAITGAFAGDFDTSIPMQSKGAATYYIEGRLQGVGPIEFMVDTGSGYLTISRKVLSTLLRQQQARYVKDLVGVLANGNELVVPVYSIAELNLGGQCELTDVEAAIFPEESRFILGLSALQKAAPFIFSLDPPALALSNCVKKAPSTWIASEGTLPISLRRP